MIKHELRHIILQTALFLGAVLALSTSLAQNGGPINLVYSETVQDAPGLKNTILAKGNVQFEHDNARLFCDSALFFRNKNIVKAYGKVQINQNDTINLFCDSLLYNGNTNISKLIGNVRFRDNEYKLTTDSLEYNGNTMQGYYRNHAVITSVHQAMKLTSLKGYYFSRSKTFFFRDSVHITDPNFELFADTLEFRTPTSTTHFHGPTTVLMDSTTKLLCTKGTYFTNEGYAELWNGATLWQENTMLYADSLKFNQNEDIGEGFCNIKIKDSTENSEIRSDYVYKFKGQNHLKLADNAKIIQFNKADTLIVKADSIDWQNDTVTDFMRAIAEYNVHIFNGAIVVRCDSASFLEKDSLIKLHKDPIIWNEENQLTSDSTTIIYYEGEFHKIFMHDNAFLASKKDSIYYDQIKGKDMIVQLDSNQLKRIYVEKNVMTNFFLQQDSEDSTKVKVVTGMNHSICNEIVVYFIKGELDRVAFLDEPEAKFYPIEDLPAKEERLKGFLWQIERKPEKEILE